MATRHISNNDSGMMHVVFHPESLIIFRGPRNRILNNDDGRTLSLNGYGLAFARLVWRASAYVTSEKRHRGCCLL
jgi:hypothetical protein